MSADPLTDAELDQLDALAKQASARAMGALWSDTRPTAYDPMIRTVCGNRVVARLSDKVIADALATALNALPALLAEVRASRERERIRETWQAVEPDTAPRLHIPADLLTRPAGGGLR